MTYGKTLALVVTAAVFAWVACDDSSTDTPPSPSGTLTITGTCDTTGTDGKAVKVAVYQCPFTMPPETTGAGTVSAGIVSATIGGLAPGTWCTMAFVDMDEYDGLAPVRGLDPTGVIGADSTSIQFDIVEDQVTVLTLDFVVLPPLP
jgi:hypothetical protein